MLFFVFSEEKGTHWIVAGCLDLFDCLLRFYTFDSLIFSFFTKWEVFLLFVVEKGFVGFVCFCALSLADG